MFAKQLLCILFTLGTLSITDYNYATKDGESIAVMICCALLSFKRQYHLPEAKIKEVDIQHKNCAKIIKKSREGILITIQDAEILNNTNDFMKRNDIPEF